MLWFWSRLISPGMLTEPSTDLCLQSKTAKQSTVGLPSRPPLAESGFLMHPTVKPATGSWTLCVEACRSFDLTRVMGLADMRVVRSR